MYFLKFRVIHNDHDVPHRLIYQALRRIPSSGLAGQDIIEFPYVIGYSNLVEVETTDEFYEEVRGCRSYSSRFVKNKLPVPCTKLAIIWSRRDRDFINVITAYFTNRTTAYCPDEPGNILRKINRGENFTTQQIEEVLEFWSKHAFVEPIPMNYME